MLDLDSPVWAKITASPGGNGVLASQLLKQLRDGGDSVWSEFYQQVCHQYSVSEVTYVAVPHLAAIARGTTDVDLRSILLGAIGTIVASIQCYSIGLPVVQDDWKEEFASACDDARIQIAALLQMSDLDREQSFRLIAAMAALHGHANLSMLLQEGPEFRCPDCGEPIAFGDRSE